jgi:hypothetical protein
MKNHIPPEKPEIVLRLDHYNDIFSDFDIRPYSKRALSIDFLDEIKRATWDKENGAVELIFQIPEKDKNEEMEKTIRERLVEHFKRHHRLLEEEKKKIMRLGTWMVVMGIVCMIAATFVVFEDPSQNLLLSFLVVFLEPAAWFLLWEGMDQIIFNSKSLDNELNFYRKMSNPHGNIYFKTY